MPKLALIKPSKLKKILLNLGFVERDAEGSHIFLQHPDGRTTVIPMKKTEISRGLLRKILNDCNISIDEYNKLRNSKK